jgi:glutaredoxin 3
MKRKVEIFSAGCDVCQEAIALVNKLACPSCEVEILNMHDVANATRAKSLGIKSVPAIVVNGELVSCCEEQALRAAGIGQAL